jgi:hypothetical protein
VELGVTGVKCNINKLSRAEVKLVIVRIKSSILADIIIVIIIMIIMHIALNVMAQHPIIINPAIFPRPFNVKGKGKAIPLQAWTGPEGSRRLRLPDFKTIGA